MKSSSGRIYEDPRFETNEVRLENREDLEPEIETEIHHELPSHCADLLEQQRMPCGDVDQINDVLAHPRMEALDLVREIKTQSGTLPFANNPFDFSEIDLRRKPMPRLGEHSAVVLRRPGYSDERIEELDGAGFI